MKVGQEQWNLHEGLYRVESHNVQELSHPWKWHIGNMNRSSPSFVTLRSVVAVNVHRQKLSLARAPFGGSNPTMAGLSEQATIEPPSRYGPIPHERNKRKVPIGMGQPTRPKVE